jgi:capsid protein
MDIFNRKKVNELQSQVTDLKGLVKKQIEASYTSYPYFLSPIVRESYTGEKTPGEMGAAKDYILYYDYLRVRSWQSFLESEITQAIINKYCKWVIGNGLYVQCEPEKRVLRQEGITTLDPDFVEDVQTRFNLWVSLPESDSAGMYPVNKLSFEAYKNAIVGGDVLTINYPEKSNVTQQVIDGSHVVSPPTDHQLYKDAVSRGNRIEYGVEIGVNNEHVAYFVQGVGNKFYRVERMGAKSGRLMAYLVYGNRYRIDNVRGLPLVSAVLETLRKLDRYKEAAVGGAEERQKIAYTVEHNANSTGEDPLLAKMSQSSALGMGEAPESKSAAEYEAAATKVATMTQKSTINMPVGAALKMHATAQESSFKDFYTTNIQFVCAAMNIPYEVALSMYNSNYSASRAAIKEWEHSMKFDRQYFSEQYYQPFYNLFLEMAIFSGKINAPGYIKAVNDKNVIAIGAYNSARWLGANVPHIDPVKEVMASRLKLGDDTTPLSTYDQESETLGSGDFKQNIEKVKAEKDLVKQQLGDLNPQPKESKNPKQFYEQLIKNIVEQ